MLKVVTGKRVTATKGRVGCEMGFKKIKQSLDGYEYRIARTSSSIGGQASRTKGLKEAGCNYALWERDEMAKTD